MSSSAAGNPMHGARGLSTRTPDHPSTLDALRQSNRALRLFLRCNTAVVHATDERQLLTDVCHLAVHDAGYRMAWVGRAERDEARTVRPVACAGEGAQEFVEFLEGSPVSWAEGPRGRGTAGTAVRTRRPGVGRDLPHNANFAVWREGLARFGCNAAIAIPLQLADEVWGVLLIYASEPDAFDSTEVSLLDEVGGNLSHGVLALRAQRKLAETLAELEVARKNLERRVVRTREQYQELVENANSIIMRMDTAGRITFANEFAERFFGYSQEELVGHCIDETILPAVESTGRDLSGMIHDIASHPEAFAFNENENVRKNGERVWISWTNKPVLDRKGRLVGLLCIGNDITSLKRTEGELLKAKEAAESADRIKSAFLATMSHELRTPLNSIIGFVGILLQGLAGPLNDEQRKQLGMVRSSSRHLLALINDVLDISKIAAGQLTILREPFDVNASLVQAVRAMAPLADKKGLALHTQLDPMLGVILGDRRRFEQIAMNLLGNAMKFTEHGSVTLRCAARGANLEMSVRDTGIGIPAQRLDELFRPFRQIDTGLARKHEGTGLGLSICKNLAELMGGSIGVESILGVGSIFTVTIPLRRGPA
jgi:PAS domain S-box-containing protein